MICETCRGRGFVPHAALEDLIVHRPCQTCQGSGVASCCDAAGSRWLDDWPRPAVEAYRDDAFPERLCDFCGTLYRGPAVYCSLECATEDL